MASDEELDFNPRRSLRQPVVVNAIAAVPAVVVLPTPGRCYGKPNQRTAEQHGALTKLMRSCKSRISSCLEEAPPPLAAAPEDSRKWILDVAFSGRTHQLTAVAHQFRKSRREIVRAIKSAAMCWLRCQLQWMHEVQRRLEGVEVDIFADTLKWDETRQVLALPISDLLSGEQSVAGWNVMVCKRRVGWSAVDGPFVWTDLVMTPQILVGRITSDAFWDSLYVTKLAKQVEDFIAFMRRKSRHSLAIREGTLTRRTCG